MIFCFLNDNPQSRIQKYNAKYLLILFTSKMCSSAYPYHSKFSFSMWWIETIRNIWKDKKKQNPKNKELLFSYILVEGTQYN